jgi:glucoamylase
LVCCITPDGYFRKGYLLEENGDLSYDDTLDISSLYGPFMFARLPQNDERLLGTARRVEEKLLNTSPIGGVLRYPGDGYFLAKQQYAGNPWIVCTAWLTQYYIHQGQPQKAQLLLDWLIERRVASGVLGEQFDPETGTPLGVAPLVWSHAELINTILDLYQI